MLAVANLTPVDCCLPACLSWFRLLVLSQSAHSFLRGPEHRDWMTCPLSVLSNPTLARSSLALASSCWKPQSPRSHPGFQTTCIGTLATFYTHWSGSQSMPLAAVGRMVSTPVGVQVCVQLFCRPQRTFRAQLLLLFLRAARELQS